jgi:hypothetical protein
MPLGYIICTMPVLFGFTSQELFIFIFYISILYVDVSEHCVCSVFIDGVSRKNNQDEIVWVFIQGKVWLENSLSQSEGGGWV